MKNKILSIILAIASILTLSVFTACGEPDNGNNNNGDNNTEVTYVRVNEEGEESISGDYIEFGSYPKTDVTDIMGDELSSYVSNLPSYANLNGWSDFGFYKENQKATYAFYKDVEHSDIKYRAVYFLEYRPNDSMDTATNTTQQKNGINLSTVYWFEYEPITWKILNESQGKALLLTVQAIDCQGFKSSPTVLGGASGDYEKSDVREFLTNAFYNTAFTSAQKEIINITLVKNGEETTVETDNNPYARDLNDTNDKIFVLSYQDMINADYGFEANNILSSARKKTATEYAMAMGIDCNDTTLCSDFWTRSISSVYNYYAHLVRNDGYGVPYTKVTMANVGVVPALYITL